MARTNTYLNFSRNTSVVVNKKRNERDDAQRFLSNCFGFNYSYL